MTSHLGPSQAKPPQATSSPFPLSRLFGHPLQEPVAEAAGPEEEAAPLDLPTKLVKTEMQVQVLAAVRFFDFCGLADGPILCKSILDMAPRHLVLVRGSSAERAELSRGCEEALSDLRCSVSVPDVGTPVHVPLPPSCTLLVSDELVEQMRLHRMQHCVLAQIEASVGPPDPHHVRAVVCVCVPAIPSILPLPASL